MKLNNKRFYFNWSTLKNAQWTENEAHLFQIGIPFRPDIQESMYFIDDADKMAGGHFSASTN